MKGQAAAEAGHHYLLEVDLHRQFQIDAFTHGKFQTRAKVDSENIVIALGRTIAQVVHSAQEKPRKVWRV